VCCSCVVITTLVAIIISPETTSLQGRLPPCLRAPRLPARRLPATRLSHAAHALFARSVARSSYIRTANITPPQKTTRCIPDPHASAATPSWASPRYPMALPPCSTRHRTAQYHLDPTSRPIARGEGTGAYHDGGTLSSPAASQ
jgi:hypothetical protein